tara:strand:- start:173 stop:520 length:348 start_codon:yes stop_codon:yes gene_type:complete
MDSFGRVKVQSVGTIPQASVAPDSFVVRRRKIHVLVDFLHVPMLDAVLFDAVITTALTAHTDGTARARGQSTVPERLLKQLSAGFETDSAFQRPNVVHALYMLFQMAGSFAFIIA